MITTTSIANAKSARWRWQTYNPHEPRRRNSGRTKPSWRVIKFYKRIHDSTILSINMPFQANRQFSPIFLFLALSFVLSFILSLFPQSHSFLSQPHNSPGSPTCFGYVFEHTRFIISAFRAAVITRRIDSRFSLLISYCFYSPAISVFFLTFSLILSYAISHCLSHSRTLSRDHPHCVTSWDRCI